MPLVALSLLSPAVALAELDRRETVRHLMFEVCPKVVAGEIDLGNGEQLRALGLAPRTGRTGWIQAKTGKKKKSITIGFRTFTGKRVCQVGFGGKDNRELFRSIIEAGEARGWRAGPGASELGGLVSFLYPPAPSTRMIMFVHWDEFDGLKPATNAGLIEETGEQGKGGGSEPRSR